MDGRLQIPFDRVGVVSMIKYTETEVSCGRRLPLFSCVISEYACKVLTGSEAYEDR